jgi:methylated-DNA-protein-cysteine methyltransferase-like protein
MKPPKRSFDKFNFFEEVYAVVRQIPYGKVTTYGAIAHHIGTGKSSRMVGWAMNHSHQSEDFVPAHRVVNRVGVLTGKHHFPTLTLMQEMLESEGIVIQNDKIVDFQQHLWHPESDI